MYTYLIHKVLKNKNTSKQFVSEYIVMFQEMVIKTIQSSTWKIKF